MQMLEYSAIKSLVIERPRQRRRYCKSRIFDLFFIKNLSRIYESHRIYVYCINTLTFSRKQRVVRAQFDGLYENSVFH